MSAVTDQGWSLRPYRPGDEGQLVMLFASVFGRTLALETWRWKLKGRPSPVENVWVAVAEGNGRIIAQYAGIPVRVKLAGSERWAMQSVDTMVSPEFRRRGILTALGTAIYASWAEAGVSAVFGVPNQNWGTRTDALGLQPLFALPWQRIPLRLGRALVRFQRLPRPLTAPIAPLADALARAWRAAAPFTGGRMRDVQLEAIGRAGEEMNALWHRIGPRYGNAVVRDAAWVNWRYLQAPGFDYRVVLARTGGAPAGYIAYRLVEAGDRRTGIIADLVVDADVGGTASALLAAALDDLWTRGAETARSASPRGSELRRTLRRAGFLPLRGVSQILLAPLTSEVDPAALRSPAEWLLAAGDFDVV